MDNKSCVEHFNTNLKSFVNNIIDCFPEYQETLSDYYNNLLETESSTEDKYVKRFIMKTTEYNSLISKRNDDLFNNDIYLLKNINFKELWAKDISDNSRDKIWEHIQHLYFLGKTLCGKISNIDNLVKQVNDETGDANEKSEDQEILDMLKNLKTKDKPIGDIPQNFFTDGLIGNLAKDSDVDDSVFLSDAFGASDLSRRTVKLWVRRLASTVGENRSVSMGGVKLQSLRPNILT